MAATQITLINADKCRACGGACCKTLPGCCVPSDFGAGRVASEAFVQNVTQALCSGRYAIDCWEGDPRNNDELPEYGEPNSVRLGYFVRPAVAGATQMFNPSWGGVCTFWSQKAGCQLTFAARPLGCRALEPRAGRCVSHAGGKRHAALAWLPYHALLLQMIREDES